MRIEWLGHAAVKVEEEKVSVIFDPCQDQSVPGILPLREVCNFIYKSHDHFDHNALEVAKKNKVPANFTETVIDTWHDDQEGALRGPNTIRMLSFDSGIRVAHMGDIGCELTDEQYKTLEGVEVLFMPVGGFYTVEPEIAASMCKRINPKVIVPIHYRSSKFGYDVLAPVEKFLKYMDGCIIKECGSSFTYEKTCDTDSAATIYVMTPKFLEK